MRALRRVAAALLAALGCWLAVEGRNLGLEGLSGPGKGFFPFLIGLALAAASFAWLARLTLAGPLPWPAGFFPEPGGLARIGVTLAALAGFALALPVVGYKLAMLALLLLLFFTADRGHPVAKIVVAVAASFGLHALFETVLKVPLPFAAIEPLRSLGL
jgi:hypothetical protein